MARRVVLAAWVMIAAAACGQPQQLAAPSSPAGAIATGPVTTSAPSGSTAAERPSAAAAASPTGGGAISGRLGYPSDFVPGLTIYAISVTDPAVWFSTTTPTFGNVSCGQPPSPSACPPIAWPSTGPGTYLISGVAPGTYYVIGWPIHPLSPQSDPPVAYTLATRCATNDPSGATPPPGPCPYPQTLMAVTVQAGQLTTNIDMVDWLFRGGTYPARPGNSPAASTAGPTANSTPATTTLLWSAPLTGNRIWFGTPAASSIRADAVRIRDANGFVRGATAFGGDAPCATVPAGRTAQLVVESSTWAAFTKDPKSFTVEIEIDGQWVAVNRFQPLCVE